MPGARKSDQQVEAFSAPKALLRQAQMEARRRGLTKSGFYRYCLAKELGFPEDQATRVAEHAGVGNFNIIATEDSGEPEDKAPPSSGPLRTPVSYRKKPKKPTPGK